MLFFSEIGIRAGEANLRAKLLAKFVSYVVKAGVAIALGEPFLSGGECPE